MQPRADTSRPLFHNLCFFIAVSPSLDTLLKNLAVSAALLLRTPEQCGQEAKDVCQKLQTLNTIG